MATLRRRLYRKNDTGTYDIVHMETEASLVYMSNGNTVENQLTSHIHDDRYYTEAESNNLLNGKANAQHTHSVNDIVDISNKRQLPFDIEWQIHDQAAISNFSATGNNQTIYQLKGFTASEIINVDAIYIGIYNITCVNQSSLQYNTGLYISSSSISGSSANYISIYNEAQTGTIAGQNAAILGFKNNMQTRNNIYPSCTYSIINMNINNLLTLFDTSYYNCIPLSIISQYGVYNISFNVIFKIGHITNFV